MTRSNITHSIKVFNILRESSLHCSPRRGSLWNTGTITLHQLSEIYRVLSDKVLSFSTVAQLKPVATEIRENVTRSCTMLDDTHYRNT